MKIVGIGLDLVNIARLRALAERWQERFLMREGGVTAINISLSHDSQYAIAEAILTADG